MKKQILWKVLAAILLVSTPNLFPVFAADALPSATEAWTATFTQDIEWQRLTDAGFLIVCTDSGLYGLNPETGATAWHMEEAKSIPQDYLEIVEGTPYAIVTKKAETKGSKLEIVMLDVTTGQAQWTSKELGIANSQGQFLYLPAGAIIICGEKPNSGKTVTVMADLITGIPIWTNDTLFKKDVLMFPIRTDKTSGRKGIVGNQPPVALPDGNFLEFWSKAGPRKIDAKTGNVIWTSPLKVKDVPGLRRDYAPICLSADGQIAYVPHEGTVDAIQLSDGKVLWKEGPDLRSKVVQMAVTPQGLVVSGVFSQKTTGMKLNPLTKQMENNVATTKPYLTVIDPLTGKPKWKKPFKDLLGATPFVIRNDQVVIFTGIAHRSLKAFNISDGTETELVEKVKFKGNENPNSLELVGGNFVLASDQNLMMVDTTGKTVYHNYHDAPGSGLLKFISENAAPSVSGGGFNSLGFWNVDLNRETKLQRTLSNPIMSRRIQALEQAKNFITMRANLEDGAEKGPGLVKIDKTSGNDVKSIILGKKKPEYLHDDIGERLYFRKDSHTIVCFTF
ncbi:hypothetical protein EHM69_11330 [candidate division KSB1 bacterium]|nr:MAG: hypothetical protein EHM69_11330 [candidate division KSB1 bacterium]